MRIIVDDLSGPGIAGLISLHLGAMHEYSPPESVHALGMEALRTPDVTVCTAWDGAELLGCGAMKARGDGLGEIKSMRTAPRHLRRGVAAAILDVIIGEARARSFTRLSLETGSGEAFVPAHALYARYGFVPCGPFGDYVDDVFARYMTLAL